MCNCKHLGKLVNQVTSLCFANDVLPNVKFVRGGGCEVREFTINGKQASVDDFGYAHDHGGEYKPQCGCADYKFEPNEYPYYKILENTALN